MFLEKLKEFPKNKILILITIIAFLSFLLIQVIVMGPIESVLKSTTGYGVLEFEFAWVPEVINNIFTAWGLDGIAKETFVTYIDFLYLLSYSIFGFGLVLIPIRLSEGKLQEVGLFMSLTPLIAGVFDVIENINLLIMLGNPSSFQSFIPFVASLSAVLKFGFLLIGIIFFVITLLIMLIGRLKKKTE
ncbi:hypothetical protein ES706_04464 [subsurface metagenome]